jgi:hypothetical protein
MISRREFVLASLSVTLARPKGSASKIADSWADPYRELARIERSRVFRAADLYLDEQPKTITCGSRCAQRRRDS